MTQWHPSLSSDWFVAARAHKVGRKPLAVTILDRPLMLVRFASGEVIAMEDRCPHRQVPLSQGVLTPEGIRCAYHGWTFDADGRCTSTPGLVPGECPPKVGARTVAVREVDGMVWVRLAHDGVDAPPRMIVDLPSGSRKFIGQMNWRGNIVDAIENFLDPLHTHTVHAGLVRKGGGQRKPMRVSLTVRDGGFVVDYQGQQTQSGLLFRLFESPRISEKLHFARPGTAQIEYRYADQSVVRITLHFTPETPQRTHVFTTMHVENRWAPPWALTLLVWPLLRKVAQQDQRMLALQAENLARFPGTRGVSTRLDFVRHPLEKILERGEALTDEDNVPEMTILL
jgi:phenylpropionate dioxygenase-like ring-hydroxylating dioxygenase large terminal subunit